MISLNTCDCEQGVTIPSQIRYVHYYSRLVHEQLKYTPRTLVLCAIKLEGIPTFSGGICREYSIACSCLFRSNLLHKKVAIGFVVLLGRFSF